MDSISELRIAGLRTIESLTLPLHGLTVLIGENGSGKSSILEACRILGRAPSKKFLSELQSLHGGRLLVRSGATALRLGATVGTGDQALDYDLTVQVTPPGQFTIVEERLAPRGLSDAGVVFERRPGTLRAVQGSMGLATEVAYHAAPSEPLLAARGVWSAHPAVVRVATALGAIDTHQPFEVDAYWAAKEAGRPTRLRESEVLQTPPDRLDLFGLNLKNVFFALKNVGDAAWRETMQYVQLGLGEHFEEITTPPVGGGSITMEVKLTGVGRIPVAALSDGELAYLAYVGLTRLPATRSLLCFDEPDQHLHPGLLVRVVQLFEELSARCPIILATHSDVLLDSLSEPAACVAICEQQRPERGTVLRRLDDSALQAWLRDYRGLGHLRSDGYLPHVLKAQ